MAWDNVPWFVGGGAEHSPEVARLMAFAAFRGAEGVLGSGDLRVTERDVPDGSVNVAPGACAILCRAAGQEYQAYAARLPVQDSIAIAATDSSGGRSDLIVARVEDPYLSGEPWADPADPKVGPYVFTRVIAGVPNTTTSVEDLGLGYSAIALARVDLPASTGTITQAMIHDLRTMVAPRSTSLQRVVNLGSTASPQTLTKDNGWHSFPSAAAWSVAVPEWATGAQVVATIAGVKVQGTSGADAQGALRLRMGSATSAATEYNAQKGSAEGELASLVAEDFYLSPALRGTTQTFSIEAEQSTSGAASVISSWGTTVVLQIRFYEEPDA